jgi:hypothetical protein
VSAVVMIADLMAAGDQSGCELFSKAATPLRWGHAIEVPDMILNVDSEFELLSTGTGHAPVKSLIISKI